MQLLTLHVEIEGYRLRLLSGFLYLRMIGDLTGESIILKLLRKILQLEAPFSLIEDTEDSWDLQGFNLFLFLLQNSLRVHVGTASVKHILWVLVRTASVKGV